MMKKALFLHGWFSQGSQKRMVLSYLGYDVIAPALSNWSFNQAVITAESCLPYQPDIIVGSSRGAAVAMNMRRATNIPMVLLAPAWKTFGSVDKLNSKAIVIHSPNDRMIPFENSVELCERSQIPLISVGQDHRLNCMDGQVALAYALKMLSGELNVTEYPLQAS